MKNPVAAARAVCAALRVGLSFVALSVSPCGGLQAAPADAEVARLVFAAFDEPPLSDAQRAAVEAFVASVEPGHKLLLPDFLTQHLDPEAKRRFQAAAPEGSPAHAEFFERTVARLNAALGDRGYGMPLTPVAERVPLPAELDTPFARLIPRASEAKDPAERVRLWTEALAVIGPLDLADARPRAHYERALAHMESHDARSAFDDFSASLRLGPGHAGALFNRAVAASELGRWDVVLRDSSALIEKDGTFALAFVTRGWAWSELGEHDAALKDLDRAVALEPENLWARLARGGELGEIGRTDAAVADCDAAVRLSTRFAAGYACLGWTYLEGGRFAEAVGPLEQASRIDGNDPTAHVGVAISRLRRGDFAGARESYERAVALEPAFGVSAASVVAQGGRWSTSPEGGESFASYDFSPPMSAAIDELVALRAAPESRPQARAPRPMTPRLRPDSPGERLTARKGRLIASQTDFVLKSKVYLEAKEIRKSPEYRRLDAKERSELERRWKEIEAEKGRLLREARGLDREGKRLLRWGEKLDKSAAALVRECAKVDLALGDWTRDCASESASCARRRKKLERKARGVMLKVVDQNAAVERWRREVDALDRRAAVPSSP